MSDCALMRCRDGVLVGWAFEKLSTDCESGRMMYGAKMIANWFNANVLPSLRLW